MSQHKNGAVDASQTVKAGCGIRYDPEVLGEESGFDFSAAERLKAEDNKRSDADKKKGDDLEGRHEQV